MILYLAGNFPQLSHIRKERAFVENLHKAGFDYNRLVSFYYQKEAEVVLRIKSDSLRKEEKPIELSQIKKPKMSKKLKTALFE
jgi:hypothetical protein